MACGACLEWSVISMSTSVTACKPVKRGPIEPHTYATDIFSMS